MAKRELPSPALLRNLLRYESDTGRLFWRARPASMFPSESAAYRWNMRDAGTEAFTAVNGHGYRKGLIFRRSYLAHRVIWAIVHDEWPANEIDHINGDASDNRIANLRAVSRSENCRNVKRRVTNTSGVTGVSWFKTIGKWCACIAADGRQINLGYYTEFDEAVAARRAAEKRYGYHVNHGRTAAQRQASRM